MLAATDSQAKATWVKLLKHLIERLENHGRVAERPVAAADSRVRRVTEVFNDTRPGTSVTTDSLAEIDASTEKVDLDLYNRYRPENAAVLQRLVKEIGKSTATVLRQVVIDDNLFQQLEQSLLNLFGQHYSQVCVVDVVAGQLADPEERERAEAKMRQVVDSCQPMWGRAEPGRLGMRFSDTVIVGVPESENSANQSSVSSLLTEIASGRSNADTRYNGSTSQVTSGDKRRICVVRRVHGGCFHYLPEVDQCRRAYDKWLADGGHSVHIIDDARVAKLPSLFPGKEVDDGQFAFAIGLCYGWVAARGPHWYWNLKEDDAKPGHFICRLTSDWNGAAFDNRKLAITTGALKSFTDTNKLVYEQRSDMLAADKLGQGMENAQQAVLANGEMIEMINDLFADMRAAVGDVSIARELETYLGSLKTRTRSSDQNYALITGMAKLLSQRVVELRNG